MSFSKNYLKIRKMVREMKCEFDDLKEMEKNLNKEYIYSEDFLKEFTNQNDFIDSMISIISKYVKLNDYNSEKFYSKLHHRLLKEEMRDGKEKIRTSESSKRDS
jgi:hypothetical protein